MVHVEPKVYLSQLAIGSSPGGDRYRRREVKQCNMSVTVSVCVSCSYSLLTSSGPAQAQTCTDHSHLTVECLVNAQLHGLVYLATSSSSLGVQVTW